MFQVLDMKDCSVFGLVLWLGPSAGSDGLSQRASVAGWFRHEMLSLRSGYVLFVIVHGLQSCRTLASIFSLASSASASCVILACPPAALTVDYCRLRH